MKPFKILVCEDLEKDENLIDLFIKDLNSEHSEIEFKMINTGFKSVMDDLKTDNYDLLILDMYEGGKNEGKDVLLSIKKRHINLSVIIYTTGSLPENQINYNQLKKEYDFFIDIIIKGDNGEDLSKSIEKLVFDQTQIDYFELYDEDDIFLRSEIIAIGKKNINEILYNIKQVKAIKDKFIIERMTSGLSGAAVFKLKYGNQSSVLKISRNKDVLEKEHKRAQKLYTQFPSRFRINIDGKEYQNDKVLAILIEDVEESTPMFDWLIKNQGKNEIESFFNNLFLSNGLKDHYKKRRNKIKESKFTHIFTKFNDIRFSMVRQAIKELEPIIESKEFEESDIKNFISNGCFIKFDKADLLDGKYKKELVLSHGDFHSNNILIKGEHPVIIDTGGIEYDYWCMDICRLIVHLFIVGFDKNTYNYYDINQIDDNLKITKKIIEQQSIELDGVNDGFINAINWLLKNGAIIYDDLFSKWEFQLGLMKEFLQTSYKTNFIPPNKRAIALLSAYQCMLAANEEVKAQIKS